jgi:glycosidase
MMQRLLVTVLVLCGFSVGDARAQRPVIEKVEPPNWWAQHSIDPVRLLVRGRNLTGATFECAKLACSNVHVNDAGTYAFVDVAIGDDLAPGPYPLTLRTRRGTARVQFALEAPLAREGRFQGFGPDDALYLLMPDRFANGDPRNDDPAKARGILDRTHGRRYHGGDLAGVRQRLPYLDSLGITAIWMNPIYDNTDHLDRKEVYDNSPTTAYHGYHAIDYYALDEHFGDMAELRRLADDAHGRGIKLIVDMVANHTSPYHPWVANSPTRTWFNGTEQEHVANTWQVWSLADPYATPAIREPVLDGWFIDLLPDLNQDDPEVARYLIQNTLWWLGMSGVDGIRQDTWPYVPRTFWRDWMAAIKREYPTVRVVGEVFDGDPSVVSFFEGGDVEHDSIDDRVDALFDFPLFYPIRRGFAQGGSLRELAQMLGRDHVYNDPQSLVTFIGLHDVARFMGEQGATLEGLQQAFTFLLTARGTPLIYYGDEIGLPGGNDPDNRRDFPGGWPGDARNAFEATGRTAAEQQVHEHVRALLRLRAEREELRRGRMEQLHVTDSTYVYRRGRSVVAFNNGSAPAEVRLEAVTLDAAAVLGGCPAPRADGGGLVLSIPARTSCLY